MKGKLTTIINKLKKIETNFNKNKTRKYTAKHILLKSKEFQDLKNKFKKFHTELLNEGKVNEDILEIKREQFQSLAFSIDSILTEKTLTLTCPGDETKSDLNLDSEIESEDSLEEFSSDDSSDSSASVSSNNSIEADKTQIEMAIDKFKALKLIPQLSNDGKNLKAFISIIKEFEALGTSQEEKTEFLKFIIETRIDEIALRKLSIQETPKNTDELQKQLSKVFKPPKTSLQVQGQLASEKQGSRKVDEFAKKIETLTSELNEIRLNGIADEQIRTFVRKEIDDTGLNAFCIGLSEPFKTVVLASKPSDLTSAVQTAKSYESSIPKSNANVFNFSNNRRYSRYNNNNPNKFRNQNTNSYDSRQGNSNSRSFYNSKRHYNNGNNGNRSNNRSAPSHNNSNGRNGQNRQSNRNSDGHYNNNNNRSYNNSRYHNPRYNTSRNPQVNQVVNTHNHSNNSENYYAPEGQPLGEQIQQYQQWVPQSQSQ